MKKWLPAILLLCVAAALCVYFLNRPPQQSRDPAVAPDFAPVTTLGRTQLVAAPQVTTMTNRVATPAIVTLQNNSPSAIVPTESSAPPPPIVLPEPDSPEQELPRLPQSTVLENLHAVFRQYGSKLGGNPVGTNFEITRALNGENPKQVRFLRMEDGMRVNEKGELIDTWGTPYFFHQLSGTEMEIHSAGPDKKMWTDDDLVTK